MKKIAIFCIVVCMTSLVTQGRPYPQGGDKPEVKDDANVDGQRPEDAVCVKCGKTISSAAESVGKGFCGFMRCWIGDANKHLHCPSHRFNCN
ncbi:uncharacterized protein LOC126842303 isoform X2 [Adelges cooleyi]|uniref:uncharacterized protein LOC126842303 isoform X2 n=1 Tax=Adelges cooleyi TaxID=133065 RepID=UPI0021801FF9|nr:uncharacterized protein LOC126842303 isoform X2 [Adelges cooleyi]